MSRAPQIHHTDPVRDTAGGALAARRLRGRLAAPVTLWTAPGPAGLTAPSTLVAEGEPDRLLGLIDPESDLWAAVQAAGRFAVAPLGPPHRQLADRFAGLFPSPAGSSPPGSWTDTEYGPVPADAGGWAGCRLDDARDTVPARRWRRTVEAVDLAEETAPAAALPRPLPRTRRLNPGYPAGGTAGAAPEGGSAAAPARVAVRSTGELHPERRRSPAETRGAGHAARRPRSDSVVRTSPGR